LLSDLPRSAQILIVRLRSLGDMALETPAIAALRAWRPDLRICVLVEPWCAAVLEGNSDVSEVILARGFVETARVLHRRHFPIVFNQHGGPRSALLTAASGSPVRVCWSGYQFSFLYNVHVPDKQEFFGTADVHTVEHRISQFYWAGLPRGPIPRTQVFPQADAAETVARALNEKGIARGTAYAVLQPGARLPAMRWPVEKFAEIARWLRESHEIASVVNIGRGDREIAANVRHSMSHCAAVMDSLDVRELIALIAGARLFVGNDSGPAHVAAAAGRPSVVIFSTTNPKEWHPWQTEDRIIHTGATFRSLRGDKSVAVSQERPIQSIGADEVRSACEDLLAAHAPSAKSAVRPELQQESE
jgi:lipopolysaccharide heptosyltransferase III